MFFSIERGFKNEKVIRRFGNITTTSTSEVLVSARPYVEQASGAQRSIQSTSATDDDGSATGARAVRITYLDTNYVLKTEDVLTNGTAKVNTVATDIRFVEKLEVIKGVAAVGAIQLMTGTTGGATEFCGIGAGTTQAFLAHHYVPAGKQAWVINWGAVATREANFKLTGQDRQDGVNLVDYILDLQNLRKDTLVNDQTLEFMRDLGAVLLPEKTYVRATVVPTSATSTVSRAWFYLWEESL